MEHCSATGFATHQESSIGLQLLYIAFGIGVLILSDDHGAAILPEIHGDVAIGGLGKQIILDGNVEIRIRLIGDDDTRHRRFLWRIGVMGSYTD